jgi:ATP-dependent exoDNAse (exonuclease V) alpha subunit
MYDYEYLLTVMNNTERNLLIIGPAGCGKSYLIKQLISSLEDIIAVAPSGIAALNIGGSTIQSYFGIKPYTYTVNKKLITINNQSKIEKILRCKILLIDEISMLRCEILDIVDYILRRIRKNPLPFGGMKLIFLGDPYQMEPVTEDREIPVLKSLYPNAEKPFSFHNASVMKRDGYFNKTFDIYQLDHDFRHQNDPHFRDMLSEIRLGKISVNTLNRLNSRYDHTDKTKLDPACQYLTVTNAMAGSYNHRFIERLQGKAYIAEAKLDSIDDMGRNREKMIRPFHKTLVLKENMKVMFIRNGNHRRGQPWVNGTIGIIERINALDGKAVSVIIAVKGSSIEVHPLKQRIDGPRTGVDDECDDSQSSFEQFPFIPAYVITIDKSQGLTLDKAAIVMEKKTRPNQLYVALSRVRALEDITILERPLRLSDVHVSQSAENFLKEIEGRINPVYYNGDTLSSD